MLKRLNRYLPYIILATLFVWQSISYAQVQRFPRPEFESGYTFPTNQYINQRGPMWEYMDVAVLVAALALTSWLAIIKRSRQGIVWMAVFSVAYFGFYRQGCICAVGSVQNVSLALFNSNYSMPLPVLLFFLIPLGFALFSGRVFCAGVCPLGTIQELVGFKQVKVHRRVEAVLASIPFIYLVLAVLFAATESQFLICRYDPFVGIFRLDAPYTMVIFGSLLLLTGIFINRPYCRYLCPYGVLQNIFSRFSFRHLTITPTTCRNCRLCEPSCPYDAILKSDPVPREEKPAVIDRKSWLYALLIPVTAAAGAVIFYNMAPLLSNVNDKVMLAKEIRMEKEKGIPAISKSAIAFYESGKTEDELYLDETLVKERFMKGAPWAGLFLGASLGIGMFASTMRQRRDGYEPDRGRCYSCGKCFKYCPEEKKR